LYSNEPFLDNKTTKCDLYIPYTNEKIMGKRRGGEKTHKVLPLTLAALLHKTCATTVQWKINYSVFLLK
jgi:hypothetical protein